jgi:hypothetical protein
MITLHTIHDLSNTYVIDLLKQGLSTVDTESNILNYHPDHADDPGNLFHILANGRYQEGKGKYYVIEEDGTYVCSAGWNEYQLEPDTALMLTRMYILPKHRVKYYIATHILPAALEEVTHYKNVWISFNEYNLGMYKWFERVDQGKRGGLFNDWPDIYRKFKPIGPKIINYTKQYVVSLSDK